MEAVALESSQSVRLSRFNIAQPFLPSPPAPHSSSMIPLLLFGRSATCVQAMKSIISCPFPSPIKLPLPHHIDFLALLIHSTLFSVCREEEPSECTCWSLAAQQPPSSLMEMSEA